MKTIKIDWYNVAIIAIIVFSVALAYSAFMTGYEHGYAEGLTQRLDF